MHKNLNELQRRRGQLIERIAHQRAALAREAAPLKSACDATDRAIATVRTSLRRASEFMQRHPAAMVGLVAALIAFKPRRLARWLGRTLIVWRSWRSLRPWLQRW